MVEILLFYGLHFIIIKKVTQEFAFWKGEYVICLYKHKVRMILAPGHTKGSAMYVLDEKYLFTGDAFKIADDRILVHPYTMDKNKAQETIYGIKGELMNYEKVFTAHYGLIENTEAVRQVEF